MITLHIIIATAIFSVMFAYRNYWQIEQQKVTQDFLGFSRALDQQAWEYSNDLFKAKWHKWQFAIQIYIGAVIAFISFVSDYSALNSLGHGLLFGSVFWLIFDTLIGYLLTNSIFHVDSNGIGTIYKNLFKKYAPVALFVSKLLFVGFSVTLSLL
jgi:hypothetical protein